MGLSKNTSPNISVPHFIASGIVYPHFQCEAIWVFKMEMGEVAISVGVISFLP